MDDDEWMQHTGPGWSVLAPPGFSSAGPGAGPSDEPLLTSVTRVGGWIDDIPIALVITTRRGDGTSLRQQAARMASGCAGMTTSGPTRITGATGAVRVDGEALIPDALSASGEEVVTQVLGQRGGGFAQLTVRVPSGGHEQVRLHLERIVHSFELDSAAGEVADPAPTG